MKDELTEDIEYFGIRISLSPTDVSSVVFRSGNITLAVGLSWIIQVNIYCRYWITLDKVIVWLG